MYVYKAACSDILVPRQRSALRSERTPGRVLQRQGTGLSSHHTAGCPHWEGRTSSALELQQLGHFMQIHGYSLVDSVGANAKMIYSVLIWTAFGRASGSVLEFHEYIDHQLCSVFPESRCLLHSCASPAVHSDCSYSLGKERGLEKTPSARHQPEEEHC
ncbi:hypothetical protein Q8A67_008703 [Cirrhinus molitorella]|uniref:Uncharacterized protein n=1 Tax=Cirrhinus molitorella TaxID=172907 RepID=A0AA88TNW8_9TELE|nr:hypothetical protein Q8A67_008703 [Cirrhinus molitorella]